MDIKSLLYAALGRKKIGTPNYNVYLENRGGRQRFRCELSVSNINYIAMGNSNNKKDAQTNAARDYGSYLIREGILNSDELPLFTEAHLESTSTSSQLNNSDNDFASNNSNKTGFGYEKKFNLNESTNYNNQPSMTQHDRYVEQKFEEVLQSESVDLTANIHGGWTMENCRQALNEYLQKNRQPPAEIRINISGNDHMKNFTANCSVFIPSLKKNISGNGQGSSKKIAQNSCCLSIVRQLFHMGIFGESGSKTKSKKPTATELPSIKVVINENLNEQICKYLEKVGITPVLNANTTNGSRSIIVDQKLEEFPVSTSFPPGHITWSPSLPNWNPWRAANIDEKPLAFMTMEEISKNLLMREKSKVIPVMMKQTRENLPVYSYRQRIIDAIANNSVVFIKGSTGCGKSTQICQYLMEEHILGNRGAHFNCFVSQPRRISAITLAERVANERCEELGDSIGFNVRFEGVSPRPYGAIMFVTVGVLMRKMEYGLRGISHIIIDEIHERDINTDFLLIVIRDLVINNPKLKIILMSATIDTLMFTSYFGECCSVPTIEMEQRTHPVQHFFLEDVIHMLGYMPPAPELNKKKRKKEKNNNPEDINEESTTVSEDKNLLLEVNESYGANVKLALSRLNERDIPIEIIEVLLIDIVENGQPGGVLIFLPGWNIISMLQNNLQRHPLFGDTNKYLILPLHSQLTGREQHRVFEPVVSTMRKIILSTNIAETSVTIDDVVYVIDSCRAREKMYSSRNNMVHFATVWASQNNLIQRRGRAGRVQEGFCFHLCTRSRYNALEKNRLAEMLRIPLHEIALTIKLLKLGSVGAFLDKAVEPPPCDAVIEAEVLLREMSALDKNLELTPLGRILARLPIDPKLGKTIILSIGLGIGDMMCTLAAATSFNTPFIPRERFYTKLSRCHRAYSGNRLSDHVGLLVVNDYYSKESEYDAQSVENFCNRNSLSSTILNMSMGAKRQLCDVLINHSRFPESCFSKYNIDTYGLDSNIDLFLSLLVYAYYPNICHVEGKGKRKVFTLEQTTALLSKLSVCVPFDSSQILSFISPLCVFTEKLRTNVISCKQISMISPLQLLLFGSRKVEKVNDTSVLLDEMILLEIDPNVAARIVALRPSLEALIVRACIHPETLEIRSDDDIEFIEILKQISSDINWLPADSEKLKNYHSTLLNQQDYGKGQVVSNRFRGRGFFNNNQQQYNSTSFNRTLTNTFFTANGNRYNESFKNENAFDPLTEHSEVDNSFNNNYINQSSYQNVFSGNNRGLFQNNNYRGRIQNRDESNKSPPVKRFCNSVNNQSYRRGSSNMNSGYFSFNRRNRKYD